MSVMEGMFGWLNAPLNEPDRTAMEAMLKAYRREIVYEKAIDKVEDYLIPDYGKDIDRQDKLLGVALKRRALGYPMSSDELEDALGEGGDEGMPVGGLALAGLGGGLTAMARPGASEAFSRTAGMFMRPNRAGAAPLPMWPNAKPGNLMDAGAKGITRLMGRVLRFPGS